MYLFMAAGLGLTIWPSIINHSSAVSYMTGVLLAILGAIGLLSLLGAAPSAANDPSAFG
jgi:hypothetical protein